MEKEIIIKISGSEIKANTIYGGVQGEHNSRKMHILFDDEWENYSKSITFFDANMKNAVKILLSESNVVTVDENGAYVVPVPSEALKEYGSFTYIIDGYTAEGEKFRSVTGKMKIREAPDTAQAGDTQEVTPEVAAQLQGAIDKINDEISALPKSFVSEEDLEKVDGKFGNYYTKEEADEQFATPSNVDDKLKGYYTKADVDEKTRAVELYAVEQSELAMNTARGLVNHGVNEAKTYTNDEITKLENNTDNKFKSYYTKEDADKAFATKTELNKHITEADERFLKLKYYGDSDIEITPAEKFNYEIVNGSSAAVAEASEEVTSSNLLDPGLFEQDITGESFSVNEDGTVTLNAQAEDGWATGTIHIEKALKDVETGEYILKPGKTYCWGMSALPTNAQEYNLWFALDNNGESIDLNPTMEEPFTIPEFTEVVGAYLDVNNTGDGTDISGTFILQISEGEITEYEVHANYKSGGDTGGGDADDTGGNSYADGSYAVITGLKDTSLENVVIPYEIDGAKVVSVTLSSSIGIVLSSDKQKSIVIPKTVTEIGEYAFAGYKGLTELILPDSITSVGAYMVAGCDGLTSIKLSSGMKIIGENAFWGCDGKIDRVEIPYGVTGIKSGAFADCNYVKEIFVPNTVTSISVGDGTTTNRASFDECGASTEAGGVTVCCEQGSYADTYAKENGIKCKYTEVEADDHELFIYISLVSETTFGNTEPLRVLTASASFDDVDNAWNGRSIRAVASVKISSSSVSVQSTSVKRRFQYGEARYTFYLEAIDELKYNGKNEMIALELHKNYSTDEDVWSVQRLPLNSETEIQYATKAELENIKTTYNEVHWDSVQNGGQRRDYSYAFTKWSGTEIKPLYPIVAEKLMYTFMDCVNVTDLSNISITLTGENPNMMYAFANCLLLEARPEILYDETVKAVRVMTSLYANCTKLASAKIYFGDGSVNPVEIRNNMQNAFYKCESMEDIEFSGKGSPIGLDLSPCTKLAKDSLTLLAGSLMDVSGAEAGTYEIKLAEESYALLAEDEIKIFSDLGWTLTV